MFILRKFFFAFFISAVIFFFCLKGAFAAYSIVVSNFPQSIDANNQQDIELEVTVNLGGEAEYYLRAAFSHPESPSAYFGYTDEYNGAEAKSFYKITTNSDGEWNGILKIRPDVNSAYFKGEGNYNFKIGYYTAAGNGPNWKYDQAVFLSYSLPSPTPALGPTPVSTLTPTPTPTIIPTITPIATSNPTPTPKPFATYKINEVKDEDGEILKNVKVYVDDVYLHHYAPEVLTFCDGCQCDSYTDCGFGQHTIKLEKTGYEDWVKTVNINPDTSDEVSPVMIFSELTSTPTPTSSLTPTPKQAIVPSLTPKPTVKTASKSGEVLGEEVATLSAFYSYQASDEAERNEVIPSSKNKIFPKIFLVVGLLILFVSAFWLWYRVWYNSD
jgi:hypothetical protein